MALIAMEVNIFYQDSWKDNKRINARVISMTPRTIAAAA